MRKVLQATVFSICATPFFSNCGHPVQDRFHFPFLAGEGFRSKAEIAVYQGTLAYRGQTRPAEVIFITSLESMDGLKRRKSPENHPDSIPVVRQTQLYRLQTGAIFATSIFWRQKDGALMRVAGSSQEWSGTSSRTFLPQGGLDRIFYHSPNEGDGELVLARPEVASVDRAVLLDELPLIARSPQVEHFRNLQIFPILVSANLPGVEGDHKHRAQGARYEPGTLSPERSEIPILGTMRKSLKVSVRFGDKSTVREYLVEDNSNRTLLAWNSSDGTSFVLKRHDFVDIARVENGDVVLP
ncbi:MAG: hypothetical protein JNM27_01620 [Leptospirales bacterium]|nr:hypothetical protein [Leptospirales bacterium]